MFIESAAPRLQLTVRVLKKFCPLPNFKNMRNSKGKISFNTVLGVVASTNAHLEHKKNK